MKRYDYLDVARGIGMMLVIIGHSAGLSNYLTYFFIQLFFIISGYLYHPGKGYGVNIKRKAKRLLIPYFSYNAVLLIFYILAGRTAEETRFSAIGILYSRFSLYDVTTTAEADNIYFFDIANGATWYLTAFFVSSLVYHLVVDRCLESRKFLIGCLTVLTIVTMALAELPVLLPWSLDIACAGALLMIVGTLLRRIQFFEKKWSGWLVFGIFVCYMVATTINPGVNISAREYGIYGRWSVPFFVIIGITGSMLCIWIGKLVCGTKLGFFLKYVGKNTVILLGFHILGLEVFEILTSRLIDVGSLTGVMFVLYHTVRISVSMCGCFVLGKLIDVRKTMIHKKCADI